MFAGEARVALEPLEDARVRWIGTQVLTAMLDAAAYRAERRTEDDRLVWIFTVLLVTVGTGLGLAVAVPALLGMRAGFEEQAGTAVALVLPWPLIGGVVGMCLLCAAGAALAVALPAIRMGATTGSGWPVSALRPRADL